ncbi:MAG: ribosome maturation factor RimP [Candidatus Omnitrophica bacterium]|nr:ribosome maturation factor RimP [Candidatus Omnitrophota bacterium]
MDAELLAKIQALAEPILAGHDMELVELTSHPQGGQRLIRFLVDRVGGVTIQQCAQANRRINEALDAADLVEGSYTVEVSSPGLDRPLVSQRDFERALGEDLDLTLQEPDGRASELRGMLLAVQREALVVKTPGGNLTVPRARVRAAKKALRW